MLVVIILTFCVAWCLVSIAAAFVVGAAIECRDHDAHADAAALARSAPLAIAAPTSMPVVVTPAVRVMSVIRL